MNIEKVMKENEKRIIISKKKLLDNPNYKYAEITKRGIERLEKENEKLQKEREKILVNEQLKAFNLSEEEI